VNSEKLNHIAKYSHEISPQDARELEELEKKFPWFTTPIVLLTKYYRQSQDYRYDDSLSKAALRVPNRAWLQRWLEELEEVDKATTPENVSIAFEEVINEPIIKEETIQPISEIELPLSETNTDTIVELENPSFELEVQSKTEPTKSLELPQEEITYEEIEDFVVTNSLPRENQPAATIESNVLEIAQEPLKVHSTKTEDDQAIVNTQFMNEEASLVAMELSLTQELSRTHFIEPSNESSVSIMDATEDDLKTVDLTPEIESAGIHFEIDNFSLTESLPLQVEKEQDVFPNPRPIRRSSTYNIEDYFDDSKNNTTEPSDFFSWLNNPKGPNLKEELITDEIIAVKKGKQELIDTFIETNPSISKPKSEFFTPANQAKKSELLPDGLVTETLAKIYLKQGNITSALRTYENLLLKNPEKRPYFAALIDKIKKENHL
jgi:hypothetical protein